MENNKEASKIGVVGWILLIIACAFVDILQFVLILALGSGLIINRFLNIGFGALLAFYLTKRGVSIVRGSRLIAYAATFFIEESGIGDFLPTWTFDVIFTWWTTKSKIAAKTIGKLDKVTNVVKPFNSGGVRAPTPQISANVDGIRAPSGGLPPNRN